jgi:hypothetical protein
MGKKNVKQGKIRYLDVVDGWTSNGWLKSRCHSCQCKRRLLDGPPQLPWYGTIRGVSHWTLYNCSHMLKVCWKSRCSPSTPSHNRCSVEWFTGSYVMEGIPGPRARTATCECNQQVCQGPPHPQNWSRNPLGPGILRYPQEQPGWWPGNHDTRRSRLLIHLWEWLLIPGHKISHDDNIRWQWNYVYQLYASSIATPMTTRKMSLDHIITPHPRILSPLRWCVNTKKTYIAILSMNTAKQWLQLSSTRYEVSLKWHQS